MNTVEQISRRGMAIEQTILDRLLEVLQNRPTGRALVSREGPLHKVADAHEARLAVAFRYALVVARKALKREKPDVEAAVTAMRDALKALLPKMLLKVVVEGGETAAGMLDKGLRAAEIRTLAGPKFKFNVASQDAVDWADRHAAELIDGITETTRERINNAIAEALEHGDIESAYEEILDAVGDKDRARLIARHETMTAASEGQRQAWSQAVDEGLLTGDERRVWIAVGDEKVCPVCEELDGTNADLDGKYAGEYDGPPAHVACRCTEGIDV